MISEHSATLLVTLPDGVSLRTLELEPGTTLNAGYQELIQVRFHGLPADEAWTLAIDDEPLPRGTDGAWPWTPQFFAGVVEARLRAPHGAETIYLLDVAPDPGKLGRTSFQELLDAVRAVDPTLLFGAELAHGSIGGLGDVQNPWVEFRRLRRYGPGFLRALARITNRPLRKLEHIRRRLPLRAATRIDVATVVGAATAGTLPLLGCGDEGPEGRAEPDFNVPWVQETLDCAANRCMRWLAVSVLRRARSLTAVLGGLVERERKSETTSALAPRWPIRREFLLDFERSLEGMMRLEPFSSVSRAEATAAGLTAVAANPDYASAQRAAWRCLRAGLAGADDEESVWLTTTWELYERWCYAEVVRLVSARVVGRQVTARFRAERCWRGESENGEAVWILLQPFFPAYDVRERKGLHSISGSRVPDIVIMVEGESSSRFLILDAKYRRTRVNVLDAMSSAHIYHDALRIDATGPACSLLMVPTDADCAWLATDEFISDFGVGVIAACPGSESRLAATIDRFLDR